MCGEFQEVWRDKLYLCVKWNPNLDDKVKWHLRSPDGNYSEYDALVPADVIGSVIQSANATKATVMMACKEHKRFADSEILTKHLKYNCHVINRIESPSEISKRFGAFSDLNCK